MTLVEVMIALLVTTVALLGALATVGVSIRGSSFSRNATEASVLAQSKLEQLVSLPAGTTGTLPANSTETTLDANGNVVVTGPYTRTTQWIASTDGLRRQVTVIVQWRDGLGASHEVRAARQQALQ